MRTIDHASKPGEPLVTRDGSEPQLIFAPEVQRGHPNEDPQSFWREIKGSLHTAPNESTPVLQTCGWRTKAHLFG